MYEIIVNGIPAKAEITHYIYQKPMGPRADSDLDCYGYTEMEFDIYDQNENRALWLESIADRHDLWAEIQEQIEKKIEADCDEPY